MAAGGSSYAPNDGSAGRGNAHERSCKYFTPGLLEMMRNQGSLVETLS
ncbi:MAG: MunI family type II restriction endonuclease [Planctomycetota bacterium]